MSFGLRVLIGAGAATLIAIAAHRARSLSRTGAIAAVVTGTAAVAAGWSWGMLLVAYFVSSSILSRMGRARKRERTAGMIEKAGPRDAMQVVSNGLPFTVAAIALNFARGSSAIPVAAAASLAASAADTWATEIGTWIGRTPRSILTGRKLKVGQSGGVSIAGLVGSLAGAVFVAGVAGLLGWPRSAFGVIAAGGIIGSLADSFAGALAQQRRWCDACATHTEMHTHDCGAATRPLGGLTFMNNDAVNLLATTVGGLFGLVMALRGAP
jgi:uncharacterized protein (TIGR00297 family)